MYVYVYIYKHGERERERERERDRTSPRPRGRPPLVRSYTLTDLPNQVQRHGYLSLFNFCMQVE